MRVFRVIVPVQDIDAAATFYQALLGADGERVTSGRHYFDSMAFCWPAGIRSPTGTQPSLDPTPVTST